MKDVRSTRGDRFVWDYWHVPGQYTHLRTPAWEYFPRALFRTFQERLAAWGRRNLGCRGLSPLWLSNYVEGCRQEWHADVPHGPWAFVFSLSVGHGRAFRGGETKLLRPETLRYWDTFSAAGGGERERAGVVKLVAPRFNRLTVFDPRVPHGVTEVKGTQDPREGRLVLHGWFSDPSPFAEGALTNAQVRRPVNEALLGVRAMVNELGELHGTAAFRLRVSAAGKVSGVAALANSVVSLAGDKQAENLFPRAAAAYFKGLEFPRARGNTEITLPILIR